MKELEMLAEAIDAEMEIEEKPDATASLDALVIQLQEVAVQFAEAVGALKAAAEPKEDEPSDPVDEPSEPEDGKDDMDE